MKPSRPLLVRESGDGSVVMGANSGLGRVKRAVKHERQNGNNNNNGGNNNNNNGGGNNNQPIQAPPAKTTAPKPQTTRKAPVAPTTTQAAPAQTTTAAVPSPNNNVEQPTVPSSNSASQQSSKPVALPIETGTNVATSHDGATTATAAASFPSVTTLSTSSIALVANPLLSITSGHVKPTTLATSTLKSSTKSLTLDDGTTANAIMGNSASGTGGMSTAAIIIIVLAVIFGSLAILFGAFYVSKKYIRKRKITISLEVKQQYNPPYQPYPPPSPAPTRPLPPIPMRMRRIKDDFLLWFPRRHSIKEIAGFVRNREKGFVPLS